MRLIPSNVDGKINWFLAHNPSFETNAVAIGSSAPEVTALVAKTEAARAARTAQQEALATAKTKTAAMEAAVELMMVAGSDLLKKVRAKAATGGDVIYNLANIPPPALPAPAPAPGKPGDFKAKLMGDGTLEILWKCANLRAAGTIYHVYRRTTPGGEFAYVGGTGQKRFLDTNIPAGTTQLTYQIQGVRSTAAGASAQFNVNFGAAPAGGATVSAASPKLAAA